MSSRIRVLNEQTINQIAAGEVIENPASVVKELVENSIDAGATEICIEIKGGGRQLIRISDNGRGMNPDDAVLCLERHATSKLHDVDEIHTLSTMGFRGEAIPSIASISKFNLLTCQESAETGTMVIVDGGKLISCSKAVRSPGTTVEVKSLFFNVPVRKKFLKSPTFDANEILKTVSLISLGHYEIKFQLISDGKNLLTTLVSSETSFKEKLRARIDCILGPEFLKHMVFIEKQQAMIGLQGAIGLSSYTRHNRSGQYLFINKRAVVSPLIAFAVKEGFHTSIPSGRFPVFVLHLTLPGNLVDVNVHPQKREVRLRQEQVIKELIVKSVRENLNHTAEPVSVNPVFFIEENPLSKPSWELQIKPQPSMVYTPKEPKPAYSPPSLAFPVPKASPFLKVLAAIPSYILIDGSSDHPFIEEKNGIVLIDQKRAFARVVFEKLSAQKPIAQQALLIPHTIELPPHEAESVRLSLPQLNKMGISIQAFGTNAFLIDAIPQVFGNSNLDVLLSGMASLESGEGLHQEQAKRISFAASRAATSLHHRLSLQEAQSLVDQLMSCQQPRFCPSGRALSAHISGDALVKLFQK